MHEKHESDNSADQMQSNKAHENLSPARSTFDNLAAWDCCWENAQARFGASSDLGSNHMHEQVNDTVGVAPLVVIPRHNLEEALLTWQVVLEGGL